MKPAPDFRPGEPLSLDDLVDGLWIAGLGLFQVVAQPVAPPESAATISPTSTAGEDSLGDNDDEGAEEPKKEIPVDDEPRKEAKLKLATQVVSEDAKTPRTIAGKGTELRTPAAPALPAARELVRALRPLVRRVSSAHRMILDEEATVQNIARLGYWLPSFRPDKERWLELALVVDQHPSMVVWRSTIEELRKLFERLGAFRDVRVWQVDTTSEIDDALHLRRGMPPRSGRELIDASGHRAILVVTDCIADGWRSGRAAILLRAWRQWQPTAILQMLPQPLWGLTGLRMGLPLWATAAEPGLPTGRNNYHTLEPLPGSHDEIDHSTAVPILTCEPHYAGAWARLLGGTQKVGVPAFALPLEAPGEPVSASGPKPDAAARLNAFRLTASDLAVRLATLFAVAPLRLPVMRLVQQACLPASRQVHLAEVVLGGILRRRSGSEENEETLTYEFHDGIRDLLLNGTTVATARHVQAVISQYLAERFGQSLDFNAILVDPSSAGKVRLTEDNQVFADVALHLLRRLGSKYKTAIAQLESANTPQHAPKKKPSRKAALLANKTILWVDDTPKFAAPRIRKLEALGATLTLLPSTKSALEYLSANHVDAIISNLSREPDDFAGFTLLDQLRAVHTPTPFLIFGTKRTERFAIQAARKGASVCTAAWREAKEVLLKVCRHPAPERPPYLPPLQRRRVERVLAHANLSVARIEAVLEHPEIEANWQTVWGRKQLPGSLCQLAISLVRAATSSSYQQIYFGTENNTLVLMASHVSTGLFESKTVEDRGLLGKAFRSGTTMFLPDTTRNANFAEGEPSTRCQLVLPVASNPAHPIGVLNVEMPMPHALGVRQIMWLEALAKHLGVRLRQAKRERVRPPSAVPADLFWRELIKLLPRSHVRFLLIRAAWRALPMGLGRPLETPVGPITTQGLVILAEALAQRDHPESHLYGQIVNDLHQSLLKYSLGLFTRERRFVDEDDLARLFSAIVMELTSGQTSEKAAHDLFDYCARCFQPGSRNKVARRMMRGIIGDYDKLLDREGRPLTTVEELGPLSQAAPRSLFGARPRRVVLVAGATDPRPAVVKSARAIGALLASAQYGLITGGARGIDEIVADSYAQRLAMQPLLPLRQMHTVVASRGLDASSEEGANVVSLDRRLDAAIESVRRVDALIILPGRDESRMIVEVAGAFGRPVIRAEDMLRLVSPSSLFLKNRESLLERTMRRPTLSEEAPIVLLVHFLRSIWRTQGTIFPLLDATEETRFLHRQDRVSLHRAPPSMTWDPHGARLRLGGVEKPILYRGASIHDDPLLAPDASPWMDATHTNIAWSPDGSTAAVWGPDSLLSISGKKMRRMVYPIYAIKHLAWSPRSDLFAVVDINDDLRVFSPERKETKGIWRLPSESSPVGLGWPKEQKHVEVIMENGTGLVYALGEASDPISNKICPSPIDEACARPDGSFLVVTAGRLLCVRCAGTRWNQEEAGYLPATLRHLTPAPAGPLFAAYLPRQRRVAIFSSRYPARPVLIVGGTGLVKHLAWSSRHTLAINRFRSVELWQLEPQTIEHALELIPYGKAASIQRDWLR